jgi:hypothetical protein
VTAPARRYFQGIDVTVYCTAPGFRDRPALYKIAAEWTGGDVTEWKTYGFADDDCLFDVYCRARQAVLGPFSVEGESVGRIQVLRLEPNRSDFQLERLDSIREQLETRWNSEQPKNTSPRKAGTV